jgi:precorrin-8X/cobalt-precorrin-8 methylmutase
MPMAPAFDRFLIVDWSAANDPKRGKDSIWICEAARDSALSPENFATRRAAIDHIAARFDECVARRERVFAGFDFPFGYPEGAVGAMTGDTDWRALWRFFHKAVEDDDRNRSNRFALADRINREILGEPVYWGRPHQTPYRDLPLKKSASALRTRMEFRRAERAYPPAKSVWQLYGAGAVGSQAILGIAYLETLRSLFADRLAVWPFETDFADRLEAPIILAEIYPSLAAVDCGRGEVKDSAQVRALAQQFRALDERGAFIPRLAAPANADAATRRVLLAEEGWIVSPCDDR